MNWQMPLEDALINDYYTNLFISYATYLKKKNRLETYFTKKEKKLTQSTIDCF